MRHGSLSLFAALEGATGRVKGNTAERHTRMEFLGFMAEVVRDMPRGRATHVILDNQSTHKTKAVAAWLERPCSQARAVHSRP